MRGRGTPRGEKRKGERKGISGPLNSGNLISSTTRGGGGGGGRRGGGEYPLRFSSRD
ncbi:hypothetical protein PUN28_012474 [Cardiocondyla obscurior]|uniref:Uncharacterized protein n=1 Tax=Cardiocondyla obscurior TaxID=286306 RepID=A0AAW2FE75_9HYME